MKKELAEIVSDEHLAKVYGNANFGDSTPRDVVRYNLLKVMAGWHIGRTASEILNELGLISKRTLELTPRGKMYLFYAFNKGNH